jgi:hypothetical protein
MSMRGRSTIECKLVPTSRGISPDVRRRTTCFEDDGGMFPAFGEAVGEDEAGGAA